MLEWVLGKREFSEQALQEALMSSVWQGVRSSTDRLLGLTERPWRVLDALRAKGDPDRLLRDLDEAWVGALDRGQAAIPNGHVLTRKFKASMPAVSHWVRQNQLDEKLPPPAPSGSFKPRI